MSAIVNQVRLWASSNDYFEGHIVFQGKDIFIPSEKKLPHVHIGKDFIVYKKGADNHSYLVNPGEETVQKSRIAMARTGSNSADIDQVCRYLESQF